MRAVFLWLAVLSLGGHRGWAQASAPPLLQNGSFENIQGVRLDAAGLYNGWQIVGSRACLWRGRSIAITRADWKSEVTERMRARYMCA